MKECIIKEYHVEGSKVYFGTTLLSQHDIFSKLIPKIIKLKNLHAHPFIRFIFSSISTNSHISYSYSHKSMGVQ